MRIFVLALLMASAMLAQLQHGVAPNRLLLQGVTVVEGNGTPAQGPVDILIEDGLIRQIGRGIKADGATSFDGRGRYVLPGFVNLHAHLHNERAGIPMDSNYVLKLWLACGITTVRDLGSPLAQTLALRDKSAKGEVAAPRIFVYPMLGRVGTPAAAKARITELQSRGVDGVKLVGAWRDTFDAAAQAATAANLPIAIHIGVEEITATDAIRNGVRTIEHWYGIPDAAIEGGVQNFPPTYNYMNEADRFRYAGRLWREADPAKLEEVLKQMVAKGVAWDPTLDIYEASRDLQRAANQPWLRDYLHPVLKEFFKPNLANHGSFFVNWSSTDEAAWKENYRIWMAALRQFDRLGGRIGMGDDAGYIYQMYGFGFLRNLELHQEAGFHPLKVVEHASLNGARILGQETKFGRVRAGWAADLLLVNGNPLQDFRLLYPVSPDGVVKPALEWTIKGGIPYSVPTLLGEVKSLVDKAPK